MTSEHRANFNVAIIGMGVRRAAHMTLEAIDVLKQCNRGFVVSPHQEAVDLFRDSLLTRLRPGESLPPLMSLSGAYRKDRLRCDNYREASGIVLEAMQSDRAVAYLTPGNPVALDTVAQGILSGARERSLRAIVIPGISSLDTVLVDLQLELAPGLQVYDASWAVGSNVRPDTRFSCLLMQTSVFGTRFPVSARQPHANALARLKDYLLQFYPSDHLVFLVRSGSGWDDPPNIYSLPLVNLDNVSRELQLGASLLIPRLDKPVLNQEFREMLSRHENLKEMCRDSAVRKPCPG